MGQCGRPGARSLAYDPEHVPVYFRNERAWHYRAADVGNPEVQAELAPYYAQQIAAVLAAATGHPATTLEVYAGWLFGPDAGLQMVSQSDSVPLGTLVSATTLRNRGMTGWTVGEFREAMTAWLGAAANQTVLTGPGIEQLPQ